MAVHASLTGADLHESKGVAAASAGTIAVANGSGGTTFKKITTTEIDNTSVISVNERYAYGVLADVSTASSVLIAIPVNATITGIEYVLGNAITIDDSTMTATNPGVGTLATKLITFAGSAEGTTFTNTFVTNGTFTGPS